VRFKTFGPFLVNADIQNKSDDLAVQFDSAKKGLNNASGVYIFAYKQNGMLVPIYVGKAQKQSFGSRIAQHLNGLKFAEFLDDRAKELSIFLVARVDENDSFLIAKVAADDEFTIISELEFSLIGSCAAVNPRLLNLHSLKHPEVVHMPGYTSPITDSGDRSARALASMLNKEI
jgi:hypothetical protein